MKLAKVLNDVEMKRLLALIAAGLLHRQFRAERGPFQRVGGIMSRSSG